MGTPKSIAAREYQKAWRAANPQKCAAYTKKYRAKDPARHQANQKRWLEQNQEHVLDYHREWRKANRDKVKAASKRWRTSNPERQKAASRNWNSTHRDYINSRERLRCATDAKYHLARKLRSKLRWAIRMQSAKKAAHRLELAGCTIEFLMGYLKAQFKPGMDWDNYGKVWEVDHILACVSFDLTSEIEQRKCFHYTNLQPLFVSENRRKRCKLPNTTN